MIGHQPFHGGARTGWTANRAVHGVNLNAGPCHRPMRQTGSFGNRLR
jgi:hypothetical protein